jgi:hypothetical protein
MDSKVKVLVISFILLASAGATFLPSGDSAECVPTCDSCHSYHDRVYYAYMDITEFRVPTSLDGAEVKQVKVTLHLYGNIALGYTTVSRGWLELTTKNDCVAIEKPLQKYFSYPPGYRSFYWNVSGRLSGADQLHVEVYGLGVHLSVEFFENADSGSIIVTNPINAPPRVFFSDPDGQGDTAGNSFTIGITTEDPNADHIKTDFYYDDDPIRENGATKIVDGLVDINSYVWDTRSIPNGWYWLHVDVDDQRGGTATSTSEFPVIVSHGNSVPYVNLEFPLKNNAKVWDPEVTFRWMATDNDRDALTFDVYVGRDKDYMELVGTTTNTYFTYAPPDNAKLVWRVLPHDGTIRGWCWEPYRWFVTDISYPVEVDLVLPADGSTVAGPDVKLMWYGRDLDYERVVYNVYFGKDVAIDPIVKGWDDPGGPILIVPDLIPGAYYKWRVEGDNPSSDRGISETWGFTVATVGSPMVELIGEEFIDGAVRLSWQPRPGTPTAQNYTVHLVGPTEGDRRVLEPTAATEVVVEGLEEDTTYRWYVVPRDPEGKEGASVPTFRNFTVDHNLPPVATALVEWVEADTGSYVIRWSASDPDGDELLYDLYMDVWNATTLVAGDIAEEQYTVWLSPDRIMHWRAVPRDPFGPGTAAEGTIVVGGFGPDVPATGGLESPPDGAQVPEGVIVMVWNATDPLFRQLAYDLHVELPGSELFLYNRSETRWTMDPLPAGSTVNWTVWVHPARGPRTSLGTWSFQVVSVSAVLPVASLIVEGVEPGVTGRVKALEPVTFVANATTPDGSGPIRYWFDFGDGLSSGWIEEAVVDHTYLTEGTYLVNLTVVDGANRTSLPATLQLIVEEGKKSSDKSVPGWGSTIAVAVLVGMAGLRARCRRPRRERGR